jgi:hypothetical protein
MIGIEETIVNNKLTTGLGDYIIHIDHATITNNLSNTTFNICLESTGATVDGIFRTFRDYVFFIQNNLMQHSGMCVSFNDLVMNSRRVRLENSEGHVTRAVIVDNVLIQLRAGDEYQFMQDALPDPVERIVPIVNNNRPFVESSLLEIARNSQNVHNSTVVLKFKILYEKIIQCIDTAISRYDISIFSIDKAYRTLIDNSGLHNSPKFKILIDVLKHSRLQNGFIYNLNANECNILKNTVLYINNCVDPKYRADTFKLLAENMIDCVENEVVVCLTGRITRMLNSLEHLVSEIDDAENVKDDGSVNIDDIRQEMLAKAMTMFNNKVQLNDIKEAIYLDYKNVSKDCLNREIDSWELEDLY